MQLAPYLKALRLLADPETQLRYEREVAIANVPAELVCMWFDDLDARRPSSELSPHEASRIEAFTSFYESRVDSLPTDGGVAALRGSEAWREIVAEARSTLEDLDGGSSDARVHAEDPSNR